MKRRSITRIVLAILTTLAIAATATAFLRITRDGDAARSTDAVQARRPTVLFVGDSYPAGVGVQDSQDAYPELIAKRANWDLHLDVQGGTGFIEDGRAYYPDTLRLKDRLAADGLKLPKVDLLIIDAGRNDLNRPPIEVANAVSEYLNQARDQWPHAKIVLIFPAYVSTATPFDGYPELLEKIGGSVSAVGGTLVDPISEAWYANVDPAAMTIRDGVHPNGRGNAFIADRLYASLRQDGIISST